jgi:transcriptional regulator of arginine metabolism
MAERVDTQSRLQALRRLLVKEDASTQDELREELEKLDFEVNQSTISRDLRKLGAIKMIDTSGRTVYRLAEEMASVRAPTGGMGTLITDIEHNGFVIVVHTSPGSASLVARQIDQLRSDGGVLGTIAGDDTVFVCPRNVKEINTVVRRIAEILGSSDN